jgi:hypothetical protein
LRHQCIQSAPNMNVANIIYFFGKVQNQDGLSCFEGFERSQDVRIGTRHKIGVEIGRIEIINVVIIRYQFSHNFFAKIHA